MMAAYKYDTKSGVYLLGVPARDLTQEDLDALEPFPRQELEAYLEGGGTAYEEVDEGDVTPASEHPAEQPTIANTDQTTGTEENVNA